MDCKRYGHSFRIRKDIGKRYFLNTGEPYYIEQCLECKQDRVKEVK